MTRSSDPTNRRRQVLKALAAAGATGLAGCSGDGDSGTGNGDGDSGTSSGDGNSGTSSGDGNSSANGWAWDNPARALQMVAEDYNEENNTDVSIESLGADAWQQRFQTAITSGSGAPDFSAVENYDVTNFADINGLMDITDRIDEAGVREDIIESKWEAVSQDGSIYAIPWDVGPTGVFYKRDVYEEAGIDAQSLKTWDDFIEAGQKLPDDVSMINLPSQNMSNTFRMLFRQLGGQIFNEDGTIGLQSENAVRAAQLIKDINDAGIATRMEEWSGGWFTAFAEGTIASVASGAWMDGTIREELPDTAGNWGVYKFPAFDEGGNRASNRGGSNLAIPAQTEDDTAERAFDFCLWAMTTPEVQNRMLENNGLFPSLQTAYSGDVYEQEFDFYGGQAIFSLFAEVAEQIEPYRFTTATPEAQDALETEIGNMLDGEKTPEEAVQSAAETLADRTDWELS